MLAARSVDRKESGIRSIAGENNGDSLHRCWLSCLESPVSKQNNIATCQVVSGALETANEIPLMSERLQIISQTKCFFSVLSISHTVTFNTSTKDAQIVCISALIHEWRLRVKARKVRELMCTLISNLQTRRLTPLKTFAKIIIHKVFSVKLHSNLRLLIDILIQVHEMDRCDLESENGDLRLANYLAYSNRRLQSAIDTLLWWNE